MKAILLVIGVLLSSGVAVAGAKLTVKPIYEVQSEEFKYQFGLSVNQQILPRLNYVGWYGLGRFTDSHEKDWQKTTQGFEYYYGLLSLGAGFDYVYSPRAEEGWRKEGDIYSSLSVKLW